MPRTCYIWDGDNVAAEVDENGDTIVDYTYKPQQYGELISQRRWDGAAWQTRYHQYDALGSTIALTDETGAITDTYTYDAWGNEIAPTSTFENPFRWVGKYGYYWDEELISYYIRRRPYQPTLGRWLSSDPIESELNAYRYCGNSPITRADLSGLADLRMTPTTPRSMDYATLKHSPYTIDELSAMSVAFGTGDPQRWLGEIRAQTGGVFTIRCRCVCAGLRRRRLQLHCEVNIRFIVVLYTLGVAQEAKEKKISVEEAMDKSYGHEQLHVKSVQDYLRSTFMPALSSEEMRYGPRSRKQCAIRADDIERAYSARLVRFMWGEMHSKTWQPNTSSPEGGIGYTPIGKRPPQPHISVEAATWYSMIGFGIPRPPGDYFTETELTAKQKAWQIYNKEFSAADKQTFIDDFHGMLDFLLIKPPPLHTWDQ